MKSYTDIKQSKTLAEFLPHETADLWYAERYEGHAELNGKWIVAEEPHYYPSLTKPSEHNWSQDLIKDIPCWSLAALLDVLPTIDNEFEPQLHRSLDKYRCTYEGKKDSCSGLWRVADNPVDVCYKMIVKLHDKKLL